MQKKVFWSLVVTLVTNKYPTIHIHRNCPRVLRFFRSNKGGDFSYYIVLSSGKILEAGRPNIMNLAKAIDPAGGPGSRGVCVMLRLY